MKQVDYIIVGQGICGTMLSYYFLKAGKEIIVIDQARDHTASKVASGIINPVTGRRIVRTWMIEELLPFALQEYAALEKELNKSLVKQCSIYDFHATPQMQQAFEERMLQDDYLHKCNEAAQWQQYFRYNYGIGEIASCLLVDMQALLSVWRNKLQHQNILLEEKFEWEGFEDHQSYITYKNIQAQKIIFCEGATGVENPYFKLLPYALNKGEVIIASIPNLPRNNIYKQGLQLVPWKDEDLFWIGSTYEWKYDNVTPTEAFRKKIKAWLDYFLKLPYKILEQVAAERPATLERRPFAGFHPLHNNIGILNGMGTKGCSLAPYFAKQLTEHIIYQTPKLLGADVKRFTRILSQ